MNTKADRDKATAKSAPDRARKGGTDVSQDASDRAAKDRDFDSTYSFGPFIFQPQQRILLERDKPVEIKSRALDILWLLIESAGKFVSKGDILARAWPTTHVADANVRVQIAELRRTLGDGQNDRRYIISVPNRGYSFVETVHKSASLPMRPPPRPLGKPFARSIPTLHNKIIGRDLEIDALTKHITQRRLVTVVGAGGVGKTTLAVSAVRQLLNRPEPLDWRTISFVDLASVADERVVASAIASALGVAMVNDDAISSLVQHVRNEEFLIVVDSCEHVISAVVDIIEAVLRHAPRIHILATSREPLRVESEWVFRVQPLAVPPTNLGLTYATAMNYPAIELFVARANALSSSVGIGDEDIAAVADICRRLDGIPLALELAAARIDAFGARGLATVLDNLFAILTKGRRKALPRHQTLYATLEWSFNLLGDRDRILLRRLAIFSGRFSLHAASSIAAWGHLSAADVVEGISDLVAQSLIAAEVGHEATVFRLLETTRAYAREKLWAEPEAGEVAKRHAQHLLERMAGADELREEGTALLDQFAALLDDLRSALNWSFSPTGCVDCGVSLTVAAVPIWLRLSLINECREWVEQALSKHSSEGELSESTAMKLHTARGWSLMYTAGTSGEMSAAWARAQDIAERLGDHDYQLRSLWGSWAAQMKGADFVAAGETARRFRLASKQTIERAIGDRMLGTSLHFLGDQAGSRLHIERMLASYKQPSRVHIERYQVAPNIAALMTLSRVLWVQGYPEQARRAADAGLDEARSLDHRLSLCYMLAQSACPIALLNGDLERAAHFVDILLEETARHQLDVWHIYANAYHGQLLVMRGDVDKGLPLIQTAVDDLRRARFMQHYSAFLVALTDALVIAGRLDAANAAIDEALEHSQRSSERWIAPEMLRLKGEIALSHSKSQQKFFVKSLTAARQQKSLGWQLRAATSLSRALKANSRNAAARELLTSTSSQFTEGFDTSDQKRARQLLDELA